MHVCAPVHALWLFGALAGQLLPPLLLPELPPVLLPVLLPPLLPVLPPLPLLVLLPLAPLEPVLPPVLDAPLLPLVVPLLLPPSAPPGDVLVLPPHPGSRTVAATQTDAIRKRKLLARMPRTSRRSCGVGRRFPITRAARASWDAIGTPRRIRVTLHGGVRTRVDFFFLVVGVLGCGVAACARSGDDSSGAGDDGGLPPGEGGVGADAHAKGDAHADAGEAGAGPSAQKACDDNAASYCTQLEQCAPFLVTVQYGDELTCVARTTPACLDALKAPGAGFTGASLEACVAARTALDCNTFLHGKPGPNACQPSGGIATSQACLYDSQCGSGYCRVASGASCGNCVTLGATGAPCTSSADCDGNLMCAGAGTCQPPVAAGGLCDTTHPCQQGLACLGGSCAQPGGLGATCDPKNKGADCDYYQGVYCDGTSSTCKAYAIAQAGSACGSAQPTVCAGDGTCFQGSCVAPVPDGSACSAQQGQNCMPPSTCTAGTCGLYSANLCK